MRCWQMLNPRPKKSQSGRGGARRRQLLKAPMRPNLMLRLRSMPQVKRTLRLMPIPLLTPRPRQKLRLITRLRLRLRRKLQLSPPWRPNQIRCRLRSPRQNPPKSPRLNRRWRALLRMRTLPRKNRPSRSGAVGGRSEAEPRGRSVSGPVKGPLARPMSWQTAFARGRPPRAPHPGISNGRWRRFSSRWG